MGRVDLRIGLRVEVGVGDVLAVGAVGDEDGDAGGVVRAVDVGADDGGGRGVGAAGFERDGDVLREDVRVGGGVGGREVADCIRHGGGFAVLETYWIIYSSLVLGTVIRRCL